jgi:hypothetical protein
MLSKVSRWKISVRKKDFKCGDGGGCGSSSSSSSNNWKVCSKIHALSIKGHAVH